MGEVMATFPSSFWKWCEGDYDHMFPFCKRRETETMASFPPSFSKGDGRMAWATLYHFSGSRQKPWPLSIPPSRRGRAWDKDTPLPFPARRSRALLQVSSAEGQRPCPPLHLHSGMGMRLTMAKLFHFSRSEEQRPCLPSLLPSSRGIGSGHGNAPTPPRIRGAETMANFPPCVFPSFLPEEGYDPSITPFPIPMTVFGITHPLPSGSFTSQEEKGRGHGLLHSFTLVVV